MVSLPIQIMIISNTMSRAVDEAMKHLMCTSTSVLVIHFYGRFFVYLEILTGKCGKIEKRHFCTFEGSENIERIFQPLSATRTLFLYCQNEAACKGLS